MNNFYFIEVNPRIQVEHTITEMITGIDIVHAQIKVAAGYGLHSRRNPYSCSKMIFRYSALRFNPVLQRKILQMILCRIQGKLMVYRSSGGFGVRLDAGNGFQGAVVTPYYDSLLVKISTWGMIV